jgi:hypothetical protein
MDAIPTSTLKSVQASAGAVIYIEVARGKRRLPVRHLHWLWSSAGASRRGSHGSGRQEGHPVR